MTFDDRRKSRKKTQFDRDAWRAGLDQLPPEARAAMAAVSAEKLDAGVGRLAAR
jgi:hypothetical protein